MKPPKTCIIILNWNGKTDTLKCLGSLRDLPYEVIVVDNGSTDDSVDVIRKAFPRCTLIENGFNLGYAGGNNIGIEYALKMGFDFFYILNNDTVVDAKCIEALLDQFAREEALGILGSTIIRMDEPELIDHLGGTWNPKSCSFDYIGYREKRETLKTPESLDYVCGAAVMIKREVFEKVGFFDPRFFLFWEEADLCFRAARGGYAIKSCPDSLIWHRISASFTGGKPHASYFVNRNRLLWIEKNVKGPQRRWMLLKLIAKSLASSTQTRFVRGFQKQLQMVRGKDTTRNQDRIIRAKAVSTATWDYLMRKFYAGRSKNFMNCH